MPIDIDQAVKVLNDAEVRIMKIDGKPVIGIWQDRDDRAVRYCLKILGMDGLPVKHLEGPDIPIRYKVRQGPEPRGMSYEEWERNAKSNQE